MRKRKNAVQSTKRRKSRFFLGAFIGFLVTAALLIFVVPGLKANFFESGKETITTTTIKNSFESIAELSVEEYNFTKVGKFSEENKQLLGIGVPLTGKNFLITYDGTVKAGLQDISEVNVEINDLTQMITVDVPSSVVLSSHIEPDSIQQYDQSNNPLNQLEVGEVSGFLAAEEDNAEKDAAASGLIERADDRVKGIFKEHVKALAEGSNLEGYRVDIK